MPSALPVESRKPARGHEPVLADEVVRLLAPRAGETAVDATFGAGGHARRIAPLAGRGRALHRHRPGPRGRGLVLRPGRRRGLRDAFRARQLRRRAAAAGRPGRARRRRADGPRPLVDAGRPARARLLATRARRRWTCAWTPAATARPPTSWPTRPRPSSPRSSAPTARSATRGPSRAPSCAAARQAPIATTGDLVEVVRSAVPTPALFAGGHPAKRVFQALRIAVNDELGSLERGLEAAFDLLRPRRPPGRDLLPLARGPDGQGLHARPQPGLHLPARPAGLRLRPRGRGRAAGAEGAAAAPGRARPQPPRPRSARLRALRRAGDDA